jgi:hypothetical protein
MHRAIRSAARLGRVARARALSRRWRARPVRKPQLCAGLNRHVAQLPAAQHSNPANFYPAAPASYYARFWHQNAINGLQYGFPYDDFAGQSSNIAVTNPQYVVLAVGW